MNESKALTPIDEADYEAIEAAVMETQRGRWFLAEYARRNRTADTGMLLEAIGRLENAVRSERESLDLDRLRFDLVEMARAITITKREIASIRPAEGTPTDLGVASEALDGIVRTTERATTDILEAAENVQEAAWTLREDGARADLCDELDRRATEIYTSCSFQDLTAQRTRRIIETLRFLEGRINAMIDVWGADAADLDAQDEGEPHTLSAKLEVFNGLDQTAIDDALIVEATPFTIEVADIAPLDDLPAEPIAWTEPLTEVSVEEAVEVEVEEAVEQPAEAESAVQEELDLGAFADIDALPVREKLVRFS